MSAEQLEMLIDALACIDAAITDAAELDQLPGPVACFLEDAQAELAVIGRKVMWYRNTMTGGVQ